MRDVLFWVKFQAAALAMPAMTFGWLRICHSNWMGYDVSWWVACGRWFRGGIETPYFRSQVSTWNLNMLIFFLVATHVWGVWCELFELCEFSCGYIQHSYHYTIIEQLFAEIHITLHMAAQQFSNLSWSRRSYARISALSEKTCGRSLFFVGYLEDKPYYKLRSVQASCFKNPSVAWWWTHHLYGFWTSNICGYK